MAMPAGAAVDLQKPGLIFLETSSGQDPIPFTILLDASASVTFYIESNLNETQLGQLVSLRLQKWRRFISVPIRDMLAAPPTSCSGRYRVAVWVAPEIKPAAVAKLLSWHTRYHMALGFSCELAYMYRDQLEAALHNADILELVHRNQLWLVQIEGSFLQPFTWHNAAAGFESNLLQSDDDRGGLVRYSDQNVVNAHSILASIRQDAWLLSVDLDEYLTISNRSDMSEQFAECFGDSSVEIMRVPATCSNCSADSDLALWMDASEQHPLLSYAMLYSRPDFGAVRGTGLVKSLMRPDDVATFGAHYPAMLPGKLLKGPEVAADCGIFVLHASDMFQKRYSEGVDAHIIDWQWVLNQTWV